MTSSTIELDEVGRGNDHSNGQGNSPKSSNTLIQDQQLEDLDVNALNQATLADESDADYVARKKKEEEEAAKKANPVSILQLFRYADKLDLLLILIGLIGAIGAGAISPSVSIVMGQAMDDVNSSNEIMKKMAHQALLFLYLAIGVAIAAYLSVASFMTAAERQARRVRIMYLRSLLRQEVGFHDIQQSGDLAVKLSGESQKFQEGIGDKFAQIIQQLAGFVTGFIIAFVKGWELSLIVISCIPILIITGAMMAFIMTGQNNSEQHADGDAGAIAGEACNGIRTVVGLQYEKTVLERYTEKVYRAFKAGAIKGVMQGLGVGIFFAVIMGVYGLSLWYGARLLYRRIHRWPGHLYTGGDILAIFYSLLMGTMGLSQAAPHFTTVTAARTAARPLFDVIERKSRIDSLDDTRGVKFSKITGDIEFKNVTFTYPARPEAVVLRNLNVTFKAGQMTALVGSSGSGKSTVLQLVERFYDPNVIRDDIQTPNDETAPPKNDGTADEHIPGQNAANPPSVEEENAFDYENAQFDGDVFVSGVTEEDAEQGTVSQHNLRSVNVANWRSHIGMVGQEPVLFAGTIKDNILNGNPNATDEQVIASAQAANAHGFITKMKNAYDTYITSKLLSGGQKQRVAISAALIKNPMLLLLDEATSALDTESERVVQRAIDNIVTDKTHPRTTLVIAHRLSTIKNADRILVFDNGAIIEDGNHKSLIALGGVYASLVAAQDMGGSNDEVPNKTQPIVIQNEPDNINDDETDVNNDTEMIHDSLINPNLANFEEIDHNLDDTTIKSSFSTKDGTGVITMNVHEQKAAFEQGGTKFTPLRNYSIWHLIYYYAFPLWYIFIPGMALSLAEGAAFPCYSLLMGSMTNLFYNRDHMMHTAGLYAVYFTVLGVGAGIVAFFRNSVTQYCGELIAYRVRHELFDQILRQEIGWHDEEVNAPGALQAKLAADTAHIRNIFVLRIPTVLNVVSSVLTGFIIALVRGWNLAVIELAIFPLLAFSGLLQFMFISGFGGKMKESLQTAIQTAGEAVSHIRTLASYNGERAILQRFEQQVNKGTLLGLRSAQIAGICFAASNFIIVSYNGLIYWYGGKLITTGKLSFKRMMQVITAVEAASWTVGQIFIIIPDFEKISAAVADVFSILKRPSRIDYTSMEGSTPPIEYGQIEFKNVFFHYPTRPDVKVLKGLSLVAKSKQTLAIVGESGGGKSTIFSLIQRFYDPVRDSNIDDLCPLPAGLITLDGHDISTMRISHLRKHLGIVGQEPVLFSGTIRENVRSGDESITDEMIYEACRVANLHELITQRLPKGYETQVGPFGMQLSGGQKQRLSIARAIVRQPKVLLLDEATSALDSRSERLVQAALDKSMQGRTTLLIAHRLDTLKNAESIIVIDKGVIVEGPGNHQQMVALNGRYANLVTAATLTGNKDEPAMID